MGRGYGWVGGGTGLWVDDEAYIAQLFSKGFAMGYQEMLSSCGTVDV